VSINWILGTELKMLRQRMPDLVRSLIALTLKITRDSEPKIMRIGAPTNPLNWIEFFWVECAACNTRVTRCNPFMPQMQCFLVAISQAIEFILDSTFSIFLFWECWPGTPANCCVNIYPAKCKSWLIYKTPDTRDFPRRLTFQHLPSVLAVKIPNDILMSSCSRLKCSSSPWIEAESAAVRELFEEMRWQGANGSLKYHNRWQTEAKRSNCSQDNSTQDEL